jgi:hypothetical protein
MQQLQALRTCEDLQLARWLSQGQVLVLVRGQLPAGVGAVAAADAGRVPHCCFLP